MRCFVAIDLPDDVRRALEAAQATLRAAAPRADVRWVSAAAMHLTLKFLGDVSPEHCASVQAAIAGVTAGTPPIPLHASGLGVFPGPARPRVIWAGLAGGLGELGALAAAVERALAPLGFPPEQRPFRGHVTLGRVRSPRGFAPLERALGGAPGAAFGRWSVTEVVLYRSHLGPAGSRYEALAHLPLAGAVG